MRKAMARARWCGCWGKGHRLPLPARHDQLVGDCAVNSFDRHFTPVVARIDAHRPHGRCPSGVRVDDREVALGPNLRPRLGRL